MSRAIGLLCVVYSGAAFAQSWAGTFPPERVATFFTKSERTSVVVIPAGDPASGARDAALALKDAIDRSGKATTCAVSADDPRGDDLVVVRQASPKAELALVVRVFPADGASAPMVVVSFFAPDGTTLAAVTSVRGVAIEARAQESASSVGVSREARESITTVLEGKEQRPASGPEETPKAAAERDKARVLRGIEVTLAPLGLPIPFGTPGDFGSLVRVGYQFTPLFGVYLAGFLRWLRTDATALTLRQVSDATSIDGHLGLGVTLVPVQLSFLSLALRAGAGVAATSIELRPPIASPLGVLPPSYAAAGLRPMGQLAVEVAFVLSPMVRVGVEARYALMSGATSTVHGCTVNDLGNIDAALRAGRPPESALVNPGCGVGNFSGTDASGARRSNDVPLALGRVREAGGLANRLSVDLSVTFSF